LSYMAEYFQKQQLFHFTTAEAVKINSTTGVPQGNPMSPSNFAFITVYLANAKIDSNHRDFDKKAQPRTIGNYSEWLPSIFSYMDDLFIFASSREQIQAPIELSESELEFIHMSFNYNKCQALWVQNGIINPNKCDIVTDKGRIQAKEYLKVFGIPVTQSQEVCDQEFIEIASKAPQADDIAYASYRAQRASYNQHSQATIYKLNSVPNISSVLQTLLKRNLIQCQK
ncbi:MAG: hypothetical protein EZS28_048874, partial [Streblomastix strix]